jgi:hypothetical protein
MRMTGFVLLGGLAGAAVGLVAALFGLVLWYDILGIGDRGGDGMSGLSTALVLVPLASLAGAALGAIWFARRARGGPVGRGFIAAALIVPLLGLAAAASLTM